MQVHITGTHPDVRDHLERAAATLRGRGDVVSIGSDGSSANPEQVEQIRQADALVCVLAGLDGLRDDGSAPGEWELETAVALGIPITAYEAASESESSWKPGWSGYRRARFENLRRDLERATEVHTLEHTDDLCRRIPADLERTRGRLRDAAPEAVQSIHRRLRVRPQTTFDAFAVSMHNMDTMYRVNRVAMNIETPAEFVGTAPGGAAANTAVALSRLGLTTAVAGAVGSDVDGADLRSDLEDNDVDTRLLLTVDGSATGRGVIHRDRHGNFMNTIYGGANDHYVSVLRQADLVDVAVTTAQQSPITIFSSFPRAAEREYQERLVQQLPDETVVAFKPSAMHAEVGADRLATMLGRCDVLLIAEAELDLLFAHTRAYDDDAKLADRLDALFAWRRRRGFQTAMIVVVYLGMPGIDRQDIITIAWGAEHYDGAVRNDGSHQQLDMSTLKNASGARDAALAGVLYGLLRGRPPIDCANLGYVLAMSVFSEYGCRAGLPRRGQVRDHWRRHLDANEPPRWLDPYG